MKSTLSHGFLRTWRARALSTISAAVALVPFVLPADIAHWLAVQFPWAPSWSHWVVAGAIVWFQLQQGRKRAKASR